tara:strand:+ start:3079 stop:3336 length:258 start_codon:yes stop_codon:yes gene_type:complete
LDINKINLNIFIFLYIIMSTKWLTDKFINVAKTHTTLAEDTIQKIKKDGVHLHFFDKLGGILKNDANTNLIIEPIFNEIFESVCM